MPVTRGRPAHGTAATAGAPVAAQPSTSDDEASDVAPEAAQPPQAKRSGGMQVVGDAEGLIKRGAHLYLEAGEPDFIDSDDEDEDDETIKYNTFVVTGIRNAGTHVIMQQLENGDLVCTMTSKDLGIQEIVSGIKLYGRLNPPSTFGGSPGAPAPKKPRAEAQPKPSAAPAKSGTAIVRFGLQKDFSGVEIKEPALFHTTTVDFSRWITAFAGLTVSASRFKATLSKDLARMIMVDDTTVYRFVITSVHEATPLVKPTGRKATGPPPFMLTEYMNMGAFSSALNDDRLHRMVVVLGKFQKKADAPDLTDEDELMSTPPNGYLSVIKMPMPDASLSDAEVPKTKPSAEEAPHKGSGHRGRASAQQPPKDAGPSKKPDGGGRSSEDEDCWLAGKRQVGAHISKDPAYAKLFQTVTLKLADISSQSRMKLWRAMTVLAASLEAEKMSPEAWGKLGSLCKFETRLDMFHAMMRELDSARSCVYLWNDPTNMATSPDFSTPPKMEGVITWSSKSAEPNSETFERLFGKGKGKGKGKGIDKGNRNRKARARVADADDDDDDEDEEEDEDDDDDDEEEEDSSSNSSSGEEVKSKRKSKNGKGKDEKLKKNDKDKRVEKELKRLRKERKKLEELREQLEEGNRKKESKKRRKRGDTSDSDSDSDSDLHQVKKETVKKEVKKKRKNGASSSTRRSEPWSDNSVTRRLRSHGATQQSPVQLDSQD